MRAALAKLDTPGEVRLRPDHARAATIVQSTVCSLMVLFFMHAISCEQNEQDKLPTYNVLQRWRDDLNAWYFHGNRTMLPCTTTNTIRASCVHTIKICSSVIHSCKVRATHINLLRVFSLCHLQDISPCASLCENLRHSAPFAACQAKTSMPC